MWLTKLSQLIWSAFARFLARPAVADWLIRRAMRTPYSPIIKHGELYMDRFWLFNAYPDTGESGADRHGFFPISIRIHHIVLPDQDRHLHDHPWNARTVILRGWYTERRREETEEKDGHDRIVDALYRRIPGDTAALKFGEYHCITELSRAGAWTLFISGRHRGTWGFLVNGVKVPWRKYLGIPEKEQKHCNTHRPVLAEVAIIYGTFIALVLWNWW